MKAATMEASVFAAVLALLAAPCAASKRDHQVDLINISTRFVTTYTNASHKAGNLDGEFIEDVVIPAVNDVVTSSGERLSNAQLKAAIDFIVASDSLASEEVSEIAAMLYKAKKTTLCTSLAKLPQSKRAAVLNRIKSGVAATGKPVPRAICPSS